MSPQPLPSRIPRPIRPCATAPNTAPYSAACQPGSDDVTGLDDDTNPKAPSRLRPPKVYVLPPLFGPTLPPPSRLRSPQINVPPPLPAPKRLAPSRLRTPKIYVLPLPPFPSRLRPPRAVSYARRSVSPPRQQVAGRPPTGDAVSQLGCVCRVRPGRPDSAGLSLSLSLSLSNLYYLLFIYIIYSNLFVANSNISWINSENRLLQRNLTTVARDIVVRGMNTSQTS